MNYASNERGIRKALTWTRKAWRWKGSRWSWMQVTFHSSLCLGSEKGVSFCFRNVCNIYFPSYLTRKYCKWTPYRSFMVVYKVISKILYRILYKCNLFAQIVKSLNFIVLFVNLNQILCNNNYIYISQDEIIEINLSEIWKLLIGWGMLSFRDNFINPLIHKV